jgi:hypothetical protein
MLPLRSENDLQEQHRREVEDSKRRLDKAAPGGVYLSDTGFYHNAEGQYVDEKGRFADEPVYAADVKARLEEERTAAATAAVEQARLDAEQRAAQDRRAAELAQQQAAATKAEADLLGKQPKRG